MSEADPCRGLRSVRPDDPVYRRLAEAEAAFWEELQPLGLESAESKYAEGPVNRYVNERFTGDAGTHWSATIARWGTFRKGLILGTSYVGCDIRILETNPELHVTFVDFSAGALQRRAEALARFRGRFDVENHDLNFIELPAAGYDLIVSSSTIHHVINLEHLVTQIERALTPDGYFFLEDYVGEVRNDFSAGKRRLFETLYARDMARGRRQAPGLVWQDASNLSPLCGVRSDEILDVCRRHLTEVEVRTAGALTVPLGRVHPVDPGDVWTNIPRWKIARAWVQQKLGIHRANAIDPHFLAELCLLGDVASDAGLVCPGIAFGVYRKRAA